VSIETLTVEEVRRRILIAMVSDDQLMNVLVLKGGNALALVHDVGQRASFDIDYSIEAHFPDLADVKRRIFGALRREFREIGFEVFDEVFVPKPTQQGPNQPDWWGGYFVEFKLIQTDLYNQHQDDLEVLRRRAAVIGPLQKRKYTIDISKNEYCAAKVRKVLDDYTIYVYSLEMIAIEKLRAICQQMPKYEITRNKTARARDFYDIYEIVTKKGINLTSDENRALFRHIFSAKGVSLELLLDIKNFGDFHEPDWPAVEVSITGPNLGFRTYFDFVVDLISRFDKRLLDK